MNPLTNQPEYPNYFSYRERHTHHRDVFERAVLFLQSAVVSLLALRFILALFGANPDNAFAHFIYAMSQPFVDPFITLLRISQAHYSYYTFEGYTLVSMLIYYTSFSLLAKLADITRYGQ
jgi:hypothetical protein